MDAIYIPHLAKAPQQTQTLEFNAHLPDLETLTPVRGTLIVSHRGNYLEVQANAETIITLACDRCLNHYNHRLVVDTSELIWLQESPEAFDGEALELEVELENLVEALPPQGHFHPDEWLYEQLCLAIPPQQLCDNACPGIAVQRSEAAHPPVDRRWSALSQLKDQLSE